MSKTTELTLAALAEQLDAELQGDPEYLIRGLAPLAEAKPDQLSFLSNPQYRPQLDSSHAGAVILHPDMAEHFNGNKLLLENPYLGFARLSHRFDQQPTPVKGIHPSAHVAEEAQVHPTAAIAAGAVIEAGAIIEANCVVGANAVIGAYCHLGAGTRIYPNATLYHNVRTGQRCLIHANSVIGGDGFGFAHTGRAWEKIAQLGGVVLGDDVEVGACTSIDRGALGDTIIGNDVKIDSQVQIAHNVKIGDHSALAGCVGIAGSTQVGQYCMLGGGVGLSGHLHIADGVQITGMSLVTGSIEEKGIYSSGTGAMPNKSWRKNAVRFKQLDDMARRLRQLERQLQQLEGRPQES